MGKSARSTTETSSRTPPDFSPSDPLLSRRTFLQAALVLGGTLAFSSRAPGEVPLSWRFGVCGDPKLAQAAARAGFDYFEWTVPGLLAPREDDAAFARALTLAATASIPCETANVFLPGDLKIVGPAVNRDALQAYLGSVFSRAEKAGLKLIVLGSAAARNVPDGFDRGRAEAQLVEFGKLAAEHAGRHGLVVAVEQLNRKESNILNQVGECARLVRAVGSPAFRMTVDGYHWGMEKDSVEAILTNASLIAHVHIATWPQRLAPGAEPCDLRPFFDALKKIGYSGRISIEGKIPNPAEDLPRALKLMKSMPGDQEKREL